MPFYAFLYKKSYYLTHPWKFFRDLKVLWTNAWHRMKYGYAWVDLWNMDSYLGQLVPAMLKELAKRSSGYPASNECPDMETYREYLYKLAVLWEYAHLDPFGNQDEYMSIPSVIELSHSDNALVERLIARARAAIKDTGKEWQAALARFVYTELGALVAKGWLWD